MVRACLLLLLLAGCGQRLPPPTDPDAPLVPDAPIVRPPHTEDTAWVPPEAGETAVVHDRAYLPAVLDVIGAATHHIRVAAFVAYRGPSVERILDALARAARRGVVVQVLMDEEGDDTPAVLQQLEEAGIEARLDAPSTVLHSKLVIADDVVVLGSHNLTDAALDHNHEGAIRVADAQVAGWYASWFDTLWASPGVAPALDPLDRTDLLPVADRGIVPALVDCLDSASTDVDLVMYAIAWNAAYPGSEVDRVLLAVEAAAARGVDVRVLLDGSDWVVDNHINDDAIERLSGHGVETRVATGPTVHAKVLRCDDTVVISDANWSYSGLGLMRGTSLVARDAAVLADTLGWMEGVRAQSRPSTARLRR